MIEAARELFSSLGYEAVKVWLARYFRFLPATRSPNIRPEGMMVNMTTEAMARPNWTILMISETCEF